MLVEVNNVKLNVEIIGNGKDLVMIHGNGEDHTIFDKTVEMLKDKYKIYLVDSRCHGKSENTRDINYELLRDDYLALIDVLKLNKPIIYGFSDGGIIALMMAIKDEERLEKIIISGANLDPSGFKWYVLFGMKLVYFFTRNEHTKKLYKMMISEPHISLSDLNNISVEVDVIAGSRDMVKTSHTRLIAKSIKKSKLEIIDKEKHGSYIVHSTKLGTILKKNFL